MIRLHGTSHIATESIEEVHTTIRETDPDVVAVELDPKRLYALQHDIQDYSIRKPFLSIIKLVQDHLSRKTGVTPGSELLEAVQEAERQGIPVALIDQDIEQTMQRLRDVSLIEKLKIVAYLLVGVFIPFGSRINLEEVPDQAFIHQLLERLRISFPQLYQVLIVERNEFMASALLDLEQEYGTVLAFVGAGHVEGIRDLLDGNRY
ncbi:MAG: TraB/GumN family protein [Candidatus Nanohaloarchaea archaeon]|nr:TraB/GumN family protein [Candidatus Nanohaloarchaea archaeon]